jgi:hypothetical protein
MQIIEALESAARKRLEFNEARSAKADLADDEYQLYDEFNSLLDCFGEIAKWALKTLLSDFWQVADEGLAIVRQEQEDIYYGEGYC